MIRRGVFYHAPSSVPARVALLTQYGDDAKILTGGQSPILLVTLRLVTRST